MDYYGLLFLYYLKGLSGKSVLRLFFNIEAGGTEQLLPENTSTPTTSPLLADIQYPDGLRTDQYFTYRETPTTVSNKARIKTIKGNTLVWNQLVRNNQQTATVSGVTFTNNGGNSWNISGTATANIGFNFNIGHFTLDKQGIYFISGCPSGGSESTYSFGIGGLKNDFGNGAIWKNIQNYTAGVPSFVITNGVTVNFTNVKFIICNLTKMFGTEKAEEILAMGQTDGIAYFRSLYPLPFYQYDSGSLLPFRGEGLKTVGKNLLDKTSFSESSNARPEQTSTGVKVISKNGSAYGNVRTTVISNLTPFIGKTFVLSANVQTSKQSGLALQVRDENNVEKAWRTTTVTGSTFVTLTITDDFRDCRLNVVIYANGSSGAVGDYSIYDDLQLEFGTSATSYEPYTSSTLSLPIQQYFPTGMKSAGTVYDELTPTKAITRIGAVDLGSLIWSYDSTHALFFSSQLSDSVSVEYTAVPNIICASYTTVKGSGYNSGIDKSISINDIYGIKRVTAKDSSYTDGPTFKNSLSGVYLYYELATPTETQITTEDANEALSLLMGKSVSSNNANQLINIITKGE